MPTGVDSRDPNFRAGAAAGINMETYEEICSGVSRDRGAILQCHPFIIVASHYYSNSIVFLKLLFTILRDF